MKKTSITEQYSDTFKTIMNQIGLWDVVKGYQDMRQNETKMINKFKIFEKSLNIKNNKRLHSLCIDDLKKIEKFGIVLDELLEELNLVANETKISNERLYKLSKMFKDKFIKYSYSFCSFKFRFDYLKRIVEYQNIENQKTR